MTPNEAYHVLGLEPSATIEAIKAAFRAGAKTKLSDLNSGGSDTKFHRVQEAYDILVKSRIDGGLGEADAADDADDDRGQKHRQPPTDAAVEFVQAFLAERGIEILFDGSLTKSGAMLKAESLDAIVAFLDQEEVNREWLIDELVSLAQSRGIAFKKSDLTRAVRVVMRGARRDARGAEDAPQRGRLTLADAAR